MAKSRCFQGTRVNSVQMINAVDTWWNCSFQNVSRLSSMIIRDAQLIIALYCFLPFAARCFWQHWVAMSSITLPFLNWSDSFLHRRNCPFQDSSQSIAKSSHHAFILVQPATGSSLTETNIRPILKVKAIYYDISDSNNSIHNFPSKSLRRFAVWNALRESAAEAIPLLNYFTPTKFLDNDACKELEVEIGNNILK